MSEGDEEEERVVLVVLDETDDVVGEEIGQGVVTVRLLEHGGVPVQVAFIDVGEVHVKLSRIFTILIHRKGVRNYSKKKILKSSCLPDSYEVLSIRNL